MTEPKHILFISSWFPNRNNLTHGIFNLYLAKAAAIYNRVSVIHVCSDENISQPFEIKKETQDQIHIITVYYQKIKSNFPILSQLKKRKRYLKAFNLAYAQLLKEKGMPQLIQLNVVLPAGLAVLHLSNKHKIPFVVNENWSGYTKEDGNYKGWMQKYFTGKIIQLAKKIMPTSSYLKEAMLNHGLTGDYEVVPNVVNVNHFKPLNNALGKTVRLIHISSLIEREKNVSGIIRAFTKAIIINPYIELVIVGEGENRKKLEHIIKENNLQNKVFFRGRITGDELVKEINEAHALIMFSHYETFCLVNIEAFACGKPVITSNAGAIPTYMNEKLGLMVKKNNETQLSEAIIKFAENPFMFDAKYIRAFSENYSYENIGKQLDAIYNKAILNSK